jgi:hypothetical protein
MDMTRNRKIMILTSRKILHSCLYAVFSILMLLPIGAHAQDALSLSISPTQFDMSGSPGQNWSSNLKIINTNPYELVISANIVNFEAVGESGQGKFIPILTEETDGQSFAEWITISDEAIVIPAEQTIQIPFTIELPENAPPGGHYAAILVGTKSDNGRTGETKVEISQVVSSLIFLSVAGDVSEVGSIREFTTENAIHESPEVKFNLRFENKGNVHLQPQGDIKILNMWGQERGVIPINKRSLFGKVVRESIRKYSFTWTGEWSLADIGRYTAIATLAYGENDRQFASAETHFWVIPWRALLMVVATLVFFVWLFAWLLRLYVRKMLLMAGVSPELQSLKKTKKKTYRKVSVVAPIGAGILDLRSRLYATKNLPGRAAALWQYVVQYKLFFIALFAIVVFLYLVIWFISSASTNERAYEVLIEGLESDMELNSEEIKYNELLNDTESASVATLKDFPNIRIINKSNVSGLAARLRYDLEVNGYPVYEISNEFGTDEQKTVIVFAPEYAKEALELSNFVGEALLSSFNEATDTEYPITIYAGSDLTEIIN